MDSTPTFARVSTCDHQNHRMTVTLRVTSESDTWLVGVQVDAEGCIQSGKGFDQRIHQIDKGTITKRVALVMDNHYGELVRA